MAKLIKELHDNYCVLDIETTGMSAEYNEIIEVGMLKVRNNKIVDKYQQLFKPNRYIPYYITDLTGISNEMVKNMPKIQSKRNEIIDFINNDIILGHNTNFDVRFLNSQINTGIDFYLDTLSFSRKIYPELISHSLENMRNYLKLSTNTHRSIADCVTTKELYDKIKEYMIQHNISCKELFKMKHY